MRFLRIPKPIIVAVGILLLINVLFILLSPRDVVESIGIHNSYLVVFLIAAIGGLSSFTSGILYGALATFASGGATPWLLGVSAGMGIGIGDSLIFLLIRYGFSSIKSSTREAVESYRTTIDKVPVWLQYVVIFFLLALTPIPNDILIVALILFGYKFKYVMPLFFVGGTIVATITAYAGESLLNILFY